MVLVSFNFCTKPLSKDNIKKVLVDALDSNTLRETLDMAIENLNNNVNQSYGLRIKTGHMNYKIKLSKKSGLPDMDLPALQYDISLRDTTEKVFSIYVDDGNIEYIEKSDQGHESLEIETKQDNKAKSVPVESKKCFFCCC